MCGRFAIIATPEMLVEAFELDSLPISNVFNITPRYNICPSQPVLAVREETAGPAAGRRVPVMLQWGLVPSWAKDPSIGSRMINARAENVREKASYRTPWKRRRCLLPADLYYEWKPMRGGRRQPYAFARRDGRTMGLGALWDTWEGGDGSVLESCTIITVEANPLGAAVHERMPLVVPPEHYRAWLAPEGRANLHRLAGLLRPFPAEAMRAWPVTSAVGRPTLDLPECIQPVGPDLEIGDAPEPPAPEPPGPEQGELF